tara:strand:- start:159 stop:338 length:180 start_codon:yes stop_codon:yes gene_type:complete
MKVEIFFDSDLTIIQKKINGWLKENNITPDRIYNIFQSECTPTATISIFYFEKGEAGRE